MANDGPVTHGPIGSVRSVSHIGMGIARVTQQDTIGPNLRFSGTISHFLRSPFDAGQGKMRTDESRQVSPPNGETGSIAVGDRFDILLSNSFKRVRDSHQDAAAGPPRSPAAPDRDLHGASTVPSQKQSKRFVPSSLRFLIALDVTLICLGQTPGAGRSAPETVSQRRRSDRDSHSAVADPHHGLDLRNGMLSARFPGAVFLGDFAAGGGDRPGGRPAHRRDAFRARVDLPPIPKFIAVSAAVSPSPC